MMKKKSVRGRIQAIKNLPDCFINTGKKIPLIRNLFFTNRGEHPLLKGIAGFVFGIILGILFHYLVIRKLELSPITAVGLSIVTSLLLAVGCSVSSQMRCTSILTFPSFCGKTGRGALKALVIAYIIAGPVQNLIVNTKEVIRTFACTTTLTYNITKMKYSLMFKPFKDALMSVKADTSEVKDTLSTVKEVAAPIANELSNNKEVEISKEVNDYMDEVMENPKRSIKIEEKYSKLFKQKSDENKKVEEEYFKKIEYRCEGVMSAAEAKCSNIFSNAYDSCYETVSAMAAWALCWPMKLTFVCNVVSVLGGSNPCDATSQMTPGFGKGYNYLMNSRNMVASEFKPPRLQYKLSKPKIPIDVRGASDTAHAIIREFDKKKSVIDSFMVILKRILSLIFIRIITSAQKYQEDYIKNIDFDNIYITKYFRKIDARRKVLGKHTLLPLKSIERRKFIEPFSITLSEREKSQIVGQCVKIILEMLTASVIIFIDRIYYESLDLVKRHGKIDFHQSGHHNLSVSVKGTGMVASVVRSIVKSFNFQKKLDQNYTNEGCLPRPKILTLTTIEKIYGFYIIIFIMIFVEGYALRARWMICAYFYPKREKRRILYSYNETLKQRRSYYKYMKKKVKTIIRNNRLEQDTNYFILLKIKYPKYFGWLSWFGEGKRKCLICSEKEKKKGREFYECPSCLYVYCDECWTDIGQCYVCFPPPTDVEDSDDEPQPANN